MAVEGHLGYSNTDFARVAQTTLADHIRDVEQAWMKNFQLLALLLSQGRVEYNCGGRGFDWEVQYKRHSVEGNTGETPRNFARQNLWKKAQLEYRGYQATDAMYQKEFLENRGEHAIINVFNGMVDRIQKSMNQALATEPYIDGNATGNTQLWHGLESFMGATQTINSSTGAARTANAADFVGYPNDTYANISTVLGQYGGENESGAVWPDGVSEPEFDFWSPLLVNYTCSGFGGGSDTWAAQGDEAMRYAIINAQRNSSLEGQITNCILARNLYYQFLNLIDNKEQIQVTSENGLRALGFKNVVVFDGVEVSWETGVPTNTGYGLNYNLCNLRCMYDTLLKSEGPEYDIDSQSYKAVVSTLSNFKWASPRNFFKLLTLA